MRAMILAAGLGTRLLPLTLARPKALVPLRGVPMLEFWVERLHCCGFREVVVNAFHLKERLVEVVSRRKWPIPLNVLEEPVLLGTGGGIKGALNPDDDEPLVVINGDIICDLPLDVLLEQHVGSGAEVSLVLHDCPEFNNVGVSDDGAVSGFGREAEEICDGDGGRMLAFTGIHFINPSALAHLIPGRPSEILDSYRWLIARGTPPRALLPPGFFWREMGSISSYKTLTREMACLRPGFLPPLRTGEEVSIGVGAKISPKCELKGTVVVGRGVVVSDDVLLRDVILWDNVHVEPGTSLRDCIVTDGMRVSGAHSGKIFAPGQG